MTPTPSGFANQVDGLHASDFIAHHQRRSQCSAFTLLIVVPVVVSVLAFGVRWGVIGFVIGILCVANFAAIIEWLRLPQRRLLLSRYFVRILVAWIGALMAACLTLPPIEHARRSSPEVFVAWMAVGWGAGWMICVICEIAYFGNSPTSLLPVNPQEQPAAEETAGAAVLGDMGTSPAETNRP
jgi:MFS family permease